MYTVLKIIYIIIGIAVGVLGFFSLLKAAKIARLIGLTSLIWGAVVTITYFITPFYRYPEWLTLNFAGQVSVSLSNFLFVGLIGIMLILVNLQTSKIKVKD